MMHREHQSAAHDSCCRLCSESTSCRRFRLLQVTPDCCSTSIEINAPVSSNVEVFHSQTSNGRAPFTAALTANFAVNTDASSSRHSRRCRRLRWPFTSAASSRGLSFPSNFRGFTICTPGVVDGTHRRIWAHTQVVVRPELLCCCCVRKKSALLLIHTCRQPINNCRHQNVCVVAVTWCKQLSSQLAPIRIKSGYWCVMVI